MSNSKRKLLDRQVLGLSLFVPIMVAPILCGVFILSQIQDEQTAERKHQKAIEIKEWRKTVELQCAKVDGEVVWNLDGTEAVFCLRQSGADHDRTFQE